ncbi:MAG TPA: acetolactate synthase small subunit [Rectinemataceae bacterium]|nr:acetolactate synthase small subunit [Rectinemataceae bacterium]
MTHVVSLLVENHEGVLSRIARLFDGRDYKLESLMTSIADDPETSRMTLVVSGALSAIEKVEKQLGKLIDVIEVDVAHDVSVMRGDASMPQRI